MLMTPCCTTGSSICIQALASCVSLAEVSVCWGKEQIGAPGKEPAALCR